LLWFVVPVFDSRSVRQQMKNSAIVCPGNASESNIAMDFKMWESVAGAEILVSVH